VRTTDALVAALRVPDGNWSISFQSRLGRDPWLTPSTEDTLASLPSKGIKKLLVICPSFVADCLETLEEIAMEGKKTFEEAGGERFTMIPCLNDHPTWIDTLEAYAKCRAPTRV